MRRHGLTLLIAGAALSGCASLTPDAGLGDVQQAVAPHLGGRVLAWARDDAARAEQDARVATLLRDPLDADAAVQVALLAHRELQAQLDALAVADAERASALRLPNPGFGFGRATRGGTVEIERSLHVDLARLLVLPLVRQVEERRVARQRIDIAQRVLALAADARRAQIAAVAAAQQVVYRRQVMDAAEASAELARRMAQVGNFNALRRAREQRFHAQAALELAHAEQAAQAARERLVRALGLWGDDAQTLRLPERLPDLPAQPDELPDIEQRAIAQRLDVQAARTTAEQAAANAGLQRATRFVSVFEFGISRNSETGEPPQRGWEIGFELPIFDTGDARRARADALYAQAANRAAHVAITARSEVREAYGAYRSAWDIARHHRDELVPLSQRIGEENLLRYNGMLIGVFELLADTRAQIASVAASIGALRDFWLARADLDAALVGRPALLPPSATSPAAADAGAPH
jgi:outer membrane protein TolC